MTAFASDRLADSAPAAAPARRRALWAVRLWLATLIGLTFAIVLVGGATRLTGSGLSITEWQPVAGVLPPMSQAAWQEAFDLYRATSQYELMNRGMSMAEFQLIYWWEWGHRQLGRFIGLVYVAGLIGFAATRAVSRSAWLALFGLGLLLGLQGLVGWIMVASGLEPGMVAVAPVKLTLHLTFACLFFGALVAAHVRFGGARPVTGPATLKAGAWALAALILVQIALGGLVAGHKAGLAYNTWPLMDGRLVPAGWLLLEPVWRNFVENVATVQLVHRIGAYALALAAALYAHWVWRATGRLLGTDNLPLEGRSKIASAAPRFSGGGACVEAAPPSRIFPRLRLGKSDLPSRGRVQGAKGRANRPDEGETPAPSALRRRAGLILALVLLQVALGVLTLVHHVPLGLALGHQGAALLLLGAAVWNAAAMAGVSGRRDRAPAA